MCCVEVGGCVVLRWVGMDICLCTCGTTSLVSKVCVECLIIHPDKYFPSYRSILIFNMNGAQSGWERDHWS